VQTGLKVRQLMNSLFPSLQLEKTQVIVQGIEVNVNASVDWLSRNAAGPDGFLYICIRNAA